MDPGQSVFETGDLSVIEEPTGLALWRDCWLLAVVAAESPIVERLFAVVGAAVPGAVPVELAAVLAHFVLAFAAAAAAAAAVAVVELELVGLVGLVAVAAVAAAVVVAGSAAADAFFVVVVVVVDCGRFVNLVAGAVNEMEE